MGKSVLVKWIGTYPSEEEGLHRVVYANTIKEMICRVLKWEGSKPIKIFAYQQMDPDIERIIELDKYELVKTRYGLEVRKKVKR